MGYAKILENWGLYLYKYVQHKICVLGKTIVKQNGGWQNSYVCMYVQYIPPDVCMYVCTYRRTYEST